MNIGEASGAERALNAVYVKNGFIAALFLFFVLGHVIADSSSVLGLVVANTILTKKYVWNLVTACFFERSPFKLLVDTVVFVYASNSLEWHSFGQFALYLSLVIVSCTFLVSVYSVLTYFTTADSNVLLVPTYGFGGVIVAFLMHERQSRGLDNILGQSIVYVSYQNLPVLYVLVEISAWSLGLRAHINDLPFSLISLIVSWSYLRFYSRNAVS
jgi:hypothetical protein